MTIQQAQQIAEVLAKHDPFARLTPELQEQANQAHRVLTKSQPTETFEEGLF